MGDPVWVDDEGNKLNKDHHGPFAGCLMVFNVGQANWERLSPEYRELINTEMSEAYAAGWAVIFVSDRKYGFLIPSEELDWIEDHAFARAMFDVCGQPEAEFDVMPDKRAQQTSVIWTHLSKHENFSFDLTAKFRTMGLCRIGGDEVMLPPCTLGE